MSHEYTIHVTTLSAGQPRPYADSVYTDEVEVQANFFNRGLEPAVDSFARRMAIQLLGLDGNGKPFPFKGDKDREWWQQFVDELTIIRPGVVRIKTIQPYCD